MAALIGASDGYSSVADFSDTSPQPNSADSGAATQDPAHLRPFLWPVLGLFPGEYLNPGVGTSETWGIISQ